MLKIFVRNLVLFLTYVGAPLGLAALAQKFLSFRPDYFWEIAAGCALWFSHFCWKQMSITSTIIRATSRHEYIHCGQSHMQWHRSKTSAWLAYLGCFSGGVLLTFAAVMMFMLNLQIWIKSIRDPILWFTVLFVAIFCFSIVGYIHEARYVVPAGDVTPFSRNGKMVQSGDEFSITSLFSDFSAGLS